MKLFYGKTPINSINIKHYEMSTSDANVIPSDVQSGRTYYARGVKGVGTGKSFEFATYGKLKTNLSDYIPTSINVIEIASLEYPVKMNIALTDMKDTNFVVSQIIGSVLINNIEHPITVSVENNLLTISCDQSLYLQVFYGKDNYT